MLFRIMGYFIIFSFVLSMCSKESGDKDNKVKIVSLKSLKIKEKPVEWKTFLEWDYKNDLPKNPVSKPSSTEYYHVGYGKNNKLLEMKQFVNNKKRLRIKWEYNERGNLIKKREYIGNLKTVSYYNLFGLKVESETYVKKKRYSIARRDYFNEKRQLVKVNYFDAGKLFSYATFDYNNESKLISKKTFNRDIRLTDSPEYETEIYLHTIEHYEKDGRLSKKIYYDQEEKKVGHWNKYLYENGQKTILTYDSKDKMIEKSVYNKEGKLIDKKLYY